MDRIKAFVISDHPLAQLVRFMLVGFAGVGVMYLVMGILIFGLGMDPVEGVDPYIAWVIAFYSAVVFSFVMNSWLTFRGRYEGSWLQRFRRFSLIMSIGGVFNALTYSLVLNMLAGVIWDVLVSAIAVFAGAMAGLVFNFFVSRRLVFRLIEDESASASHD